VRGLCWLARLLSVLAACAPASRGIAFLPAEIGPMANLNCRDFATTPSAQRKRASGNRAVACAGRRSCRPAPNGSGPVATERQLAPAAAPAARVAQQIFDFPGLGRCCSTEPRFSSVDLLGAFSPAETDIARFAPCPILPRRELFLGSSVVHGPRQSRQRKAEGRARAEGMTKAQAPMTNRRKAESGCPSPSGGRTFLSAHSVASNSNKLAQTPSREAETRWGS